MWFQENDNELFMFRYQEAHFKLNEKNETHIWHLSGMIKLNVRPIQQFSYYFSLLKRNTPGIYLTENGSENSIKEIVNYNLTFLQKINTI